MKQTDISTDKAAMSNDEVQWRIRSSNGEGLVWLIWEGQGRKLALNLGSKKEARTALAEWLQGTGGDVDPGRHSSADPWNGW